jgi:hypothetical protein
MMGGSFGRGWTMWGYGWHPAFGFVWLGGVFTTALPGAIFAYIYNAVDARKTQADRGSASDSGTEIQRTA